MDDWADGAGEGRGVDPWPVGALHGSGESRGPLRGLGWDMVRDVLASPGRTHRIILGLACLLVDEDAGSTTVQSAAARLRTTEVAVLEAVSRMPGVFRLARGGHAVSLVVPGRDPAEPSPREEAAAAKAAAAGRRREARAAAQEAADAERTPANECRVGLEGLGLSSDDARGFARFMVATYGTEASRAAIAEAVTAGPMDPRSWITAALKKRMAGTCGGGMGGKAGRVLPFVQGNGTRETKFIGWSSREPRVKLFRLPEGRIKEVAPEPGEDVPSLAADPGFYVA